MCGLDEDDKSRVTCPLPVWTRASRPPKTCDDLSLPLHCAPPAHPRLYIKVLQASGDFDQMTKYTIILDVRAVRAPAWQLLDSDELGFPDAMI